MIVRLAVLAILRYLLMNPRRFAEMGVHWLDIQIALAAVKGRVWDGCQGSRT